jgi:hypothetical protein
MSSNLILGCIAVTIGIGTFIVRFLLPTPKDRMQDPYVRVMRSGWFAPLVFGLLPLIAGLTFLGAWLHESDAPTWSPQPSTIVHSSEVAR